MSSVPAKRIIAKLDIKGSRVIKGIRYEGLRVVGDPYDLSVSYYHQGVDEIFYSDSVASLYGRNSLPELLKRTCRDVFIPITAGGGIQSVEDARTLLASGADKVAINTALFSNPRLIYDLANEFGRQAVVVSIQCRSNHNDWECMTESGRERTGYSVLHWLNVLSSYPVGEFIINSIDQDGTLAGPNLALLSHIQDNITTPLIFGGGINSVYSLDSVLASSAVSGVSIASLLHFNKSTVRQLKESSAFFSSKDNPPSPPLSIHSQPLVGVVDYGCGNLFSLCNALNRIGCNTQLISTASDLQHVSTLFLPGVGSFPHAVHNLHERDLFNPIKEFALSGSNLIGICLGMQLLFTHGTEISPTIGLDLIQGSVNPIPDSELNGLPLPHIGWSDIKLLNDGLLTTLDSFYFVHSFIAAPVDTSTIIAVANYGNVAIPAIVRYGNIVGFQFHPERSSLQGLSILSSTIRNLLDLP